MGPMNKNSLMFMRLILFFTMIFSVLAFIGVWKIMQEDTALPFRSNWLFVWPFFLMLTTLMLVLLVLTWHSKTALWIYSFIEKKLSLKFTRTLSLILFIFSFLFYLCTVLFLHQLPAVAIKLIYSSVRLWVFWLVTLLGMISLKVIRKDFSWPFSLIVSVVALAAVYSIAANFTLVNNYPFSLGWSETTNYYRASVLFAGQIYGMKLALLPMHATLNFMLAAPFLLGNLPIWMHRAWYVILSVSFSFIVGFVFVRRLKVSNRQLFWLLVAWTFLFLMQGPIHIHLLACAFIFLWGTKPQKFWRTTLVVVLASVWAGMSRINWYPVPGLFAAVLYLLEVPYIASGSRLRYLWKPVFWFIFGLVTALASQFAYVLLSGNANQPGGAFTSLTSDLLWYRLFPNATNSIGILASVLIVSLPLLTIIYFYLRRRHAVYQPLRLIGIFSALLVLFLGGLVVSIKIGGGSDLHNMDAYFILLMLVGGYFYFDRMTPAIGVVKVSVSYPLFIIVITILVPVWMAIQVVSPIFTWDREKADQALATIRSQVEGVNRSGGEVLFISQRHLLALNMVNVPLVPEYEQDYLMEMVMSHNRAYLDQFQQDLEVQRFAMIIANEQTIQYYWRTRSFGEENDLWVQEVSAPMLCYYRPNDQLGDVGIVLYVPREEPCK